VYTRYRRTPAISKNKQPKYCGKSRNNSNEKKNRGGETKEQYHSEESIDTDFHQRTINSEGNHDAQYYAHKKGSDILEDFACVGWRRLRKCEDHLKQTKPN
jgi:hypothetical protein